MNRLISAKPLLAAALAFGALAATSAAHARTDVFLSIQAPFGYVQQQPVYVQPRPVYVQPQAVYAQPQPYYAEPQPYYVEPQQVYYPRHHRHHDRYGAWGDADRDGVPNRYDRAPNNPYRR
jgi:hypothetical protein